MSPSTARVIRGFCIVGLAAFLASLYVHYQLLANPSYSSFCDVSATVSCTQAYLSRFGTVQGVPVALFGVLWFAFILFLSFVAAGLHVSRETSGAPVLFVLSLPAVPVIGYFAYAAFVVLRVVCVLWRRHAHLAVAPVSGSGRTSTAVRTRVIRKRSFHLSATAATGAPGWTAAIPNAPAPRTIRATASRRVPVA